MRCLVLAFWLAVAVFAVLEMRDYCGVGQYQNHSGVCETYAPLSPELLHAIDSMKASAPSGDIIL
jgi:hypothetical protein